jgi:thymidylate synthase (FAD)
MLGDWNNFFSFVLEHSLLNHHQSIHYMSVTLIHSTEDGDNLVAYMARVSNPSNQNNTETSARLIKYLIRHKHWSPFEMVNMCVQIETTRSVAAQILRHRSFSFQEFSQRYAEVGQLGKPVVPEFRLQDLKNRQNSIEVDGNDPFLEREVNDLYRHSQQVYDKLLEAGVAKECAREVLPLATPTRMYMNGTLRSWIHYCDLRCEAGTQKEHRVIAEQCKELIALRFPQVFAAVWA